MVRAPVIVALVASGLPAGANAACACIYQGENLPADTINKFPTSEPGKYKNLSAIDIYGTTCAAWEMIVGTPWFDSCDATKLMNAGYQHCGVPWCYVDSTCDSKIETKLFDGVSPSMYYSYDVCGGINCYGNESVPACPYDPNTEETGRTDKKASCKCKYYANTLPSATYTSYPSADPGKWKNYSSIEVYGTSCAAWDQIPGTPWASSCPPNSDWCHEDYNWCQAPWCYVASGCSSAVSSSVFKGSSDSTFSYNTCADTPDCFSDTTIEDCPYNPGNEWYSAKVCSAWTEEDSDGSPACWGVSGFMSLLTLFAMNL